MVPRREALLGSTFETRKISSRRPAIARRPPVRRRHTSPRCRCGSCRDRCHGARAAIAFGGRPGRYTRCPARSGHLRPAAPYCRSFMSMDSFADSPCNQSPISATRTSAGHQLRHVETIAVLATDRDIGAARSGAGLDARDQLAIGREHEHMPERRMRHGPAARLVHGQTIGAAGYRRSSRSDRLARRPRPSSGAGARPRCRASSPRTTRIRRDTAPGRWD